ncbi:MAG: competence/damage-inducible protein A [Gemmatimonadota bacterium]|nr:competence/damage-inducible protein A [Gemmatimonadota bacterium]
MRIEIVTVGDELLLGFTMDTNAAHLARELGAIGVEVVRRATVGDDAAAIADAVREALDRSGAVITTGGLGPTSDDMTKPAIAALFGRALRLDNTVLAAIEQRFRDLGHRGSMPPSNRQQALIPVGARVLENHHGSAPGIWLEDERGRWVAMLPGVPREMRGMTADTLLPLLAERAGSDRAVVLSRTLRTTGIGESALAEQLAEDAREVAGIPLAYLPGWEGTDLRLTVRGIPASDAARKLDRGVSAIRARVGRWIYAEGEATLAEVVLGLCRAGSVRIATAESCTGGMLGAMLTAIPGSSDVFLGGAIVYANELKTSLVGVPEVLIREQGAVSEPVARAMAEGICDRLGSEIGVGITGIAGPGGGSADKPVGTVWIAAKVRGETTVLGRALVGDRQEIRRRACQASLDLIRRALT